MAEFNKLFGISKPIIGMIHLAGDSLDEKINRALNELSIFQEEGVNGAIIEDYHGMPEDVYNTLKIALEPTPKTNLVLGINILRDPYSAFRLANQFGAKFVQFDSVQKEYLNLVNYERLRKVRPHIAVLGGVEFKYVPPTGNPLMEDLEDAKQRCEAIVTTGDGTGIETPIEKLRRYRELLGSFPLISGAGVNLENAYEQLSVADAAIIGSYFKPKKNTRLPVDRQKVRDLMSVVKEIRRDYQ